LNRFRSAGDPLLDGRNPAARNWETVMKTFILVVATLAVTTSAFAEAGGPVRQGNKCWAASDARGYGFWDKCATGHYLSEINQRQGLTNVPQPVTPTALSNGGGDGGGGGGGGQR
jgi:hypothetical protein